MNVAIPTSSDAIAAAPSYACRIRFLMLMLDFSSTYDYLIPVRWISSMSLSRSFTDVVSVFIAFL